MLIAVGLAMMLGLQVQAEQATARPEQPPAVPMLRAYANLVQVPVLVLTDRRLRAAPMEAKQFRLRIDGGPRFLPKYVRPEGLDPIRLVLLVEPGPRTVETLVNLREALEQFAKRSLHGDNVISVGVLRGCYVRHLHAVPGLPEQMPALAQFVQQELQTTGTAETDTCSEEARQTGALRVAMQQFGDSTSRRVLLLLTDGQDALTPSSVLALRNTADAKAISIFALREQSAQAAQRDTYVLKQDSYAYLPGSSERHRDPLVDLTDRTGGATLETRGHPLEESLERVLRLVRERYIVEFARSSELGGGNHALEVEVKAKHLYVRSAGVGYPLPNPEMEADPHRVPGDKSAEPPVGKRRILSR